MAPGGSVWDHKADKDLLLAIIEKGELKSIIWPEISDKMKVKGYTFSKEACRQHFQKIRKESRNASGSKDDGDASPAPGQKKTKSTPSKSKSFTSSFATSNGYNDGGDDEEMNTPLKRKRMTKLEDRENGGQTAPQFKMEDVGGDGSPIIGLEQEDLYDGYA